MWSTAWFGLRGGVGSTEVNRLPFVLMVTVWGVLANILSVRSLWLGW